MLVRMVLATVIRVLEVEAAQHDQLPGPVLSEFQLGRHMTRRDQRTAVSIARDLEGEDPNPETVDAIQHGWGELPRPPRQRTGGEDLLEACREVERALKRSLSSDERSLLRNGTKLRSWTRLSALHYPHRKPQLLAADYDRLARRFYTLNERLIVSVADLLVRIGPIKGIRR